MFDNEEKPATGIEKVTRESAVHARRDQSPQATARREHENFAGRHGAGVVHNKERQEDSHTTVNLRPAPLEKQAADNLAPTKARLNVVVHDREFLERMSHEQHTRQENTLKIRGIQIPE
jgi:hypothetical protein